MMMDVTHEAKKAAWKMGIIAAWYLRDDQLPLYYHLHEHKNPFLECSRRYGKTTTILAYVLEKLRQNPGWVCRWCEPNKNQAREIILPELEKIMNSCPEEYRFKWQVTDSVAVGPQGQRLYLRGVNEDRGDSSRGSFANIVVADEFGNWRDPEYVVNEALRPQLLTTGGQFIFASTPPKDLDHAYYKEKYRAITEDRFISRVITDNKGLTEEQVAEFIQAMGGINSPAVRRELFCEEISDPEQLVIPEYSEERVLLEDDFPQPEAFDIYVGGDSGADDNTSINFGYYHFENDWDVVEEEIVLRGKTSNEIVSLARDIEKRLFGDKKPFIRVYDAPKQLILDITGHLGWSVVPPKKDDRHAAIHAWRRRVGEGRFKVKRRCKHLHRQMKVGMWRDEKKTDFSRSDELGHLDALASALYFQRSIVRTRSPYLPLHGYNPHTQHVSPLERAPAQQHGTALVNGFRPMLKRGIGS